MPGDLRDSRKRQSKCRETCGTPANAKANAGRLAGLPQTPKQMPGDLRDSRKRQSKCRETCGSTRKRPKVLRGTCNSVVDISKSTLTIAWILRVDSLLALFLHRTHVTIQSAKEVCGGRLRPSEGTSTAHGRNCNKRVKTTPEIPPADERAKGPRSRFQSLFRQIQNGCLPLPLKI